MERDSNEVAQDDVESAVSLLREGRLSSEVDKATRTCYERVKGIIYSVYSASFGIKTVVSKPSNREIRDRIETI